MDCSRFCSRARHSSSNRLSGSEESELDSEKNCCNHPSPQTLQPFPSAGQHCESSAAYFSWPSWRLSDAAEERANYFVNLQKGVLPETLGRLPKGQRANSLLELMTIRAFHSKILRCYSLGTAVGFRIQRGVLTDIPAILVFVSRKVHKQWLNPIQCLPNALEGPGGVWCDVDVVEFSYFGAPEPTPKEQLYTEIVDDLRGGDLCIGSGSQVASQETYGTLGAIVRSRIGNRQVGFLTNRHVAVDLDYPSQKMFHPLPPTLGPGVYLGAVERATSFTTDERWYGIFAGINPAAVQIQRATSATGIGSTVGDFSPREGMGSKEREEDKYEPLGLQIEHIPLDVERGNIEAKVETEFHLEDGIKMGPSVEHQFIPSFVRQSPLNKTNSSDKDVLENLASLRSDCEEDSCFSLHLGDQEAKRRRANAGSSSNMEELK